MVFTCLSRRLRGRLATSEIPAGTPLNPFNSDQFRRIPVLNPSGVRRARRWEGLCSRRWHTRRIDAG